VKEERIKPRIDNPISTKVFRDNEKPKILKKERGGNFNCNQLGGQRTNLKKEKAKKKWFKEKRVCTLGGCQYQWNIQRENKWGLNLKVGGESLDQERKKTSTWKRNDLKKRTGPI